MARVKKKKVQGEARKYNFSLEVLESALLKVNANRIISNAMLEGTSIEHFELYPSIVGNQEIGTLNLSGSILKAQTCDFDDSTVVIGAKVVTACGFSVMLEICQWDIEKTYVAALINSGDSFNAEIVPAILVTAIEELITEKVREELELIAWQGNTELDENEDGSLALCDGLNIKYMEALESGAMPVSNFLAAREITKDNVIAFLTEVYEKLPKQLKRKKKSMKFFASTNIISAYKIATASQSNEIYFMQDRPLTFLDIEMIEATGALDDTFATSLTTNFAKLTDMVSDTPKFNVVNMGKSVNEPKLRFRSDFKFGVDILNENDHFAMLPAEVVGVPTLTSISPTTGTANADVTITLTGTNLSTASGVTFAGVAVAEDKIERTSDTSLKITVNLGAAGSKAVVVKGLGGDSSASSITVS